MKRNNDLGTGLMGCDDGIDERLGEEVFSLAFFFPPPVRPKSR
jgi:hypothetical protein